MYSTVPSVDPSSITTISVSTLLIFKQEDNAVSMCFLPFRTGMMIETSGRLELTLACSGLAAAFIVETSQCSYETVV
jgi:cell division protein FtsW (lipid II flippase)